MIDKDELKQSLTLEEVFFIVSKLNGKPTYSKEGFIADTICHNAESGSHKLYYYDTSKSFHCYTGDCGTFDIYDLIKKVFKLQKGQDITFEASVFYVLESTGRKNISFQPTPVLGDNSYKEATNLLNFLDRIENYQESEKIILKEYPDNLIKNLPTYHIEDWEKNGISYEAIKKYEVKYYAPSNKIVIPHRDVNGRLIGIRGRSLNEEDVINYGKYMPMYAGDDKNYPHPLGYNLYGLYQNKGNIKKNKKAIIFEGEKSVLAAETLLENNYSVAVCGSNLTDYQLELLLNEGVEEIIIAFDRQYKKYCDEEFKTWWKKFLKIKEKCRRYARVSFVYDTKFRLGYKDSPVDKGRDIFYELLKERKAI